VILFPGNVAAMQCDDLIDYWSYD